MIMLLFVMHILQKLVSYSMICLQMQATIKEEPLEEENEEEETRDDFAPQQRSRWDLELANWPSFLFFVHLFLNLSKWANFGAMRVLLDIMKSVLPLAGVTHGREGVWEREWL